MNPTSIFLVDLVTGYVVATLFAIHYFWPKVKSMDRLSANRLIATIHSFRYYGLTFLLPGVVGAHLPSDFAVTAAYGDFLAATLAIGALVSYRRPKIFWPMVWLFNLAGMADLVIDTANAVRLDLPSVSGQLGANFAIPTIYVPVLFVTHVVAFGLLLRGEARGAGREGTAPGRGTR
ncbi:hypothetical protein [Fimbriimonas ginsengisoli]|uniref:Uncharacterized protein n=1 Tax=Fimbriimonas ginsengisoli Gsoil 348 TaxID=661478 RepID=A0A068NQ58_FIMGI|nr:hypothetical protein [Fimbriimonas ginsengisoli]AIE85688.1 hypothetical protein OP10G_2320 [Fimbriimonas ginsengisoli Gsoil 348]